MKITHKLQASVAITTVVFTSLLTGCNQPNTPSTDTQNNEIKTIRVAIGTQDTTINCATGGLLIRELNLLDKYLPKDGKYKNVKYDIEWKNFTSGAPLTTEMVADHLDLGAMAEFPAVNNYTAFQKAGKQSLFISPLSGGILGSGNAIVVPKESKVNTIADLKGQTVSVPFASTAHGLLLRVIQEQGWTLDKDIRVIAQAPELAGPALKSNKIAAHADFVPFGELFPYEGFARKIYDGSQAKLPTFHGLVANKSYADQYPEVVEAYLRASLEANQLIEKDPEKYSQLISDKTGIPAEVIYLFHGPLGLQTRDFTWKPEYRQAVQTATDTLKLLGKNDGNIDINQFISDQYIKGAFEKSGIDYSQALNNYGKSPLIAKDHLTGQPIKNYKDVTQIWVKDEDKVRDYETTEHALSDLKKIKADGKTIRAVYSQDYQTDIKLLSNLAWFVASKDGKVHAFLLKVNATQWANEHGGKVYNFESIQKLAH